jgi:hypothetical protein
LGELELGTELRRIANFPSFSLKGKLAVPFHDRQQGRNRSSGECGWRKMPVPEQQPGLFYGTSARISGNAGAGAVRDTLKDVACPKRVPLGAVDLLKLPTIRLLGLARQAVLNHNSELPVICAAASN